MRHAITFKLCINTLHFDTLKKTTHIRVRFVITCRLFDGMVHNDAHGLVHIVQHNGDIATVELVGPHYLAGVAL